MASKVLKFFRENPVAGVFGANFVSFALFGINWYHNVNYELKSLREEIEELKVSQALIESSVRGNKKVIKEVFAVEGQAFKPVSYRYFDK